MKCPCCGETVSKSHFVCQAGGLGGRSKSDAKRAASRANGALGGRPRNKPTEEKVKI